jgi:hypothetical protein
MSTTLTTPEARVDDTGRTHRPIATVVELCLYRAVTEGCGGRILPFGVRQRIRDYAFVKFETQGRDAVKLWCGQRAVAVQRYWDINDWDVSQVTDMSWLLHNSAFNDRIDGWDVRNVTAMKKLFYLALAFNQPLDTWNVSQVTTIESTFRGTSSFNQSLSKWDASRVTILACMFCDATSFNQPVVSWTVSQVTNMTCMVCRAPSFNQPLSTWDVSRVTHGMYVMTYT